jgi:hypothetical protein
VVPAETVVPAEVIGAQPKYRRHLRVAKAASRLGQEPASGAGLTDPTHVSNAVSEATLTAVAIIDIVSVLSLDATHLEAQA